MLKSGQSHCSSFVQRQVRRIRSSCPLQGVSLLPSPQIVKIRSPSPVKMMFKLFCICSQEQLSIIFCLLNNILYLFSIKICVLRVTCKNVCFFLPFMLQLYFLPQAKFPKRFRCIFKQYSVNLITCKNFLIPQQ